MAKQNYNIYEGAIKIVATFLAPCPLKECLPAAFHSYLQSFDVRQF